ncbi:hypothetical protein [Hufsiella ginkgonis]|uniref:Lipoprotein n=1 Tax=Hufsiella ginkgonis TaxID=2695274 RepID=A0A7K1Y4H0_9SPHI|nr:hypothetical protein [Hufsiella ginkgonis]MXV18008.1 hypothetical protein [Hufsiella ginkgonis]
MKNLLIAISLTSILALQSCSAMKDITGKYSSKYYEHFLKLNLDSTFKYEFRSFHMYAQSSGKWLRTGKKKLLLSSNIKTTIVPVKMDVLNARYNSLSININTSASLESENYRCQIYLDDSLFTIRRADSLSEFKLEHLPREIYLKFTFDPKISTSNLVSPAVITEKLNIDKSQQPMSIKLNIDLPGAFFYYKPFNHELVKIKRNSVAFYNSYKRKWEAIPKVTDSVNIFIRD